MFSAPKRAIYIGGVKGVGKTTILRTIESRIDFQIVDLAEIMMRHKNIDERDKLDELTTVDRIRARSNVFQNILEENAHSKIIFDGHFSISNSFGHEWGIPYKFIRSLGPFIFIFAPPELILDRRKRDIGRKRGITNLSEIRLDSEVEKSYARFVSEITRQPLYEIENINLPNSCEQLIKILMINKTIEQQS